MKKNVFAIFQSICYYSITFKKYFFYFQLITDGRTISVIFMLCFDVPLGKTESVNWNSLTGVFVSGAPGVWASTNKDPSLLQSCLFPVPCSLTVYLAEHCVWSGCRFLLLLSVCDFSIIIYTHIFSVRLWWDHFNIMLTMSVFFLSMWPSARNLNEHSLYISLFFSLWQKFIWKLVLVLFSYGKL